MIIVYIIIGYLLITCIALICEIVINLLTMNKYDRENCETIGDFFNEIKDEIDPLVFIPLLNFSVCISFIFVVLFILFYQLYHIIKINVHWNKILKIRDKILNIRIVKKNK